MRVEAGKFYKTRDGRKEGPIEYNPKIINHGKFFCGSRYWTLCGHVYGARVPCGGDLIAEWTDEPRPWGELTDAEKGALLLAAHEGKEIEFFFNSIGWEPVSPAEPVWCPSDCYRVKPEPVVETVKLYGKGSSHWGFSSLEGCGSDTHRITFTTKDGEPDCDSIKMERIDV